MKVSSTKKTRDDLEECADLSWDTSRFVLEEVNELRFQVITQPPYSPDPTSTDFHLYQKFNLFV